MMWMYYEKATASKHVLRASSAFTWRCKLTTMSMEVFRYMRKTLRQVTLVSRSRVLNGLVEKLRLSGYSQGTVRGIIESGLKFYYQKLRVDLEGGPSLNARRELDTMTKRRAKMGANQQWFKRRRGGGGEGHKEQWVEA